MLSFKEYLDQDKQLTLECKAFMLAISTNDHFMWGTSFLKLKEHRKRMSIILKQNGHDHMPDGFLVLNPRHLLIFEEDIIKYGLLTGFWNPDGYGLPYYLDKDDPDWVNAAMCANVQEKAEQKQIAKLAKQLYEELKDAL